VERSTKVFRKTRVSQQTIKEDEAERDGTNSSVQVEELTKGYNPLSKEIEP
jgi:hypothetical protein